MQSQKLMKQAPLSPKSLIDADGFKMPKALVDLSSINDPSRAIRPTAGEQSKKRAAMVVEQAGEPESKRRKVDEGM